MSASAWLCGSLVVWLVLTIVRQVFDLIGRLWVPVVFNLLQLLSVIAGLFSVSSRRLTLLVLLTISCLLSISYNVLLILWYYDVLPGVPRLLSAGLPYGQSFFIRNTPGCNSFFNLTSSTWNQQPCAFPYYNAESLQAVIHIMLAILTFVFSVTFSFERRLSSKKIPIGHGPDQPGEVGYSYMNNSYDSPRAKPSSPDRHESARPSSRLSVSSDRRATTRRATEHKTIMKKGQYIVPGQDQSHDSQEHPFKHELTEDENTAKQVSDRGEVSRANRLHTEYRSMEDGKIEYRKVSNVMAKKSALKKEFGVDKFLDEYARIDSTKRRHRSEYLSPDQLSRDFNLSRDSNCPSVPGSPLGGTQVGARLANHAEQVSRRLSKPASAGNLTALISFDPKSNDILKVREHQNDTDLDDSMDFGHGPDLLLCDGGFKRPDTVMSTPSLEAPVLVQPQPSSSLFDSGHPSTSTNSTTDWPTELPITRPGLHSPGLQEHAPSRGQARPAPSTQFPATPFRPQRQVSVSTQMPLLKPTRQLLADRRAPLHPQVQLEQYNRRLYQQARPLDYASAAHFHQMQASFGDDLPPPLSIDPTFRPPQRTRKPDPNGLLV